ncbi:hypothetical protein [Cohnella thermotolerans]|uniref:hypothetical protein n=1 Tax=Cohnella thermotolerans TaxID=329858 RepID=UPI000406F2AA|nr:hypothetical protein [Cohnella thermotolerans]
MVAVIIGCEIAFWVFVLAGLFCRYALGKRRIGALLLYCTPVVDLVLLAVAAIDLKNGARATMAHGLAAVYIGVSIAFGHSMIQWADARFMHRFAGGPAPAKKAGFGREHARQERSGWYRHLLAWAIGCALLYATILIVNVEERTESLDRVIRLWSLVLGIDFLISFSYTLWPKRAKDEA